MLLPVGFMFVDIINLDLHVWLLFDGFGLVLFGLNLNFRALILLDQ